MRDTKTYSTLRHINHSENSPHRVKCHKIIIDLPSTYYIVIVIFKYEAPNKYETMNSSEKDFIE